MRRMLMVIMMLCNAVASYGQGEYVSEVRLMRNERWWGLWVGGDSTQPFVSEFSAFTGEYGNDFFIASMMISDNGRYVWSEYPMRIGFDGKIFTIASDHEKVEVKRGGNSLREAYLVCYHNNIRAHGNGTPPRELFTGPVYDISIEEALAPAPEKLIGYADGILAAGLPAGTLLLPGGWESGSRELDFNMDIYPDPAGTIRILHEKGFKVMLTLSPYISAAGINYAEAVREGRLLTGPDGEPLCFRDRGGYYVCLDFTLPEVAAQFSSRTLEIKEKYGVDGFMLDCREAAVFLAGQEEKLIRYVTNWNEVGQGVDMKIHSPAYHMPSSVAGLGKEGKLSWESLSEAVGNAVVAGLSGYIYPCVFPGYIDDDTDPQLLLRAIQLSLMMPVAVLPPTAWEMEDVRDRNRVKEAVELRRTITGYISDLFEDSKNTAEPMARHMAYQFNNQGFWNCTDQFVLGTKYLVAPVLDGSPTRTVRLPRGTWVAPDGRTVRGPRVVTADVSGGNTLVYTLQGR